MGDSKALPGFGQVDLDLGDDPNVSSLTPAAPESSFGRVGRAIDEDGEYVPPSTSRVISAEGRPAPESERAGASHDESTRILSGDALSAITRPPPALDEDGATRSWAEIDGVLGAAADTSASRSGNQPAPSASGVAARDDRVAAMRELYARGDAAGALALASTLGHGVVLPSGSGSADSPDASIVVEFGEQSVDITDPFGGLILLDEEPPPPLAGAPRVATAPPPAAHLTLTQRQSIPRRIIGSADISKLDIDHRAGFLLAHVDGMQTLEEILDICAMPAAEALALFDKLSAIGAIEFE